MLIPAVAINYGVGLILPTIFVLILSYLLGSISFSIILTKVFKHGDIRDYGSGNAGATNVLRTVGKSAALLTFILDFAKCAISVILGRLLIAYACTLLGAPEDLAQLGAYVAGFACILGHMFPIYFRFRGGKGVVTSAAMVLLIDWRVFLVLFAIFLFVFSLRRIVSLASIIGCGLYPVATFLVTFFFDYVGSPLSVHGTVPLYYLVAVTLISGMAGAVVVVKHKENIKRLLKGTEKPISFKKQ